MITQCPRCSGNRCNYCNGIGLYEYADFNVAQDTMLRKAIGEITELKKLLSAADEYLEQMEFCSEAITTIEAIKKLREKVKKAIHLDQFK